MNRPQIRFDDGASYETYMGVWSQSVGDAFLRWLAPASGWRWVDVGCGNAAFTEMLVERCAAAEVQGIDPAEAQIAFARSRLRAGAPAAFQVGDAQALPWDDARFDAAVMALVIFFVPDPPKAVAEMARVTRPGGSVSAYAWDLLGGGLPYVAMINEMKAMGIALPATPSEEASRLETMRSLWQGAGLVDVETRTIEVQRSFESFERFWEIAQTGPRVAAPLAGMGADERARLRDGVRQRLPAVDAQGRLTYGARANAVKGRVPD
jgi:ubiquinone/menaquinone biosynthesis C-methylase UbiE